MAFALVSLSFAIVSFVLGVRSQRKWTIRTIEWSFREYNRLTAEAVRAELSKKRPLPFRRGAA